MNFNCHYAAHCRTIRIPTDYLDVAVVWGGRFAPSNAELGKERASDSSLDRFAGTERAATPSRTSLSLRAATIASSVSPGETLIMSSARYRHAKTRRSGCF